MTGARKRSYSLFGKGSVLVWVGCLAVALVVDFLFTGVWTIQENQQGVILRFGAQHRMAYPGLVLTLPWPLEEVEVVNIKETFKMPVGFRYNQASDPSVPTSEESEWLTGDTNVIDVEMMIHYTISKPADYLFRVGPQDADFLIRKCAESVLTETLGVLSVDAILTTGKSRIERVTREKTQELLDRFSAGVTLSSANLQTIAPPAEVIDAFKDVSSAKADRERAIQEADGYSRELLPTARYQAAQIDQQALVFQSRVLSEARGKAEAFKSLHEEYKKASEITETRLYYEAMARVLSRARLMVVPGDSDGKRKVNIIDS